MAAVYIMASSSVVEDVLAVAAVARKFLQSLKTKIKEGEKEGDTYLKEERGLPESKPDPKWIWRTSGRGVV